MCMQCVAGASVAMGSASGIRSWLATRPWMTPKRLKRTTIAVLAAGVCASATLSGSGAPPPASAHSAATASGTAQR